MSMGHFLFGLRTITNSSMFEGQLFKLKAELPLEGFLFLLFVSPVRVHRV